MSPWASGLSAHAAKYRVRRIAAKKNNGMMPDNRFMAKFAILISIEIERKGLVLCVSS